MKSSKNGTKSLHGMVINTVAVREHGGRGHKWELLNVQKTNIDLQLEIRFESNSKLGGAGLKRYYHFNFENIQTYIELVRTYK